MKSSFATSIPVPANSGPVERWWFVVRAQTFRQLPLETALSLPIPVRQEDGLYLTVFYYGVKRVGGPGTGHALPPIARVSAGYPEVRLLSFMHRKMEELFPGLPDSGDLGPLTGNQTSPNDRMQTRQALFESYARIIELYQKNKGTLAERKEFSSAFANVAEPALLPFYRALNPDFFEWLEREK